MKKKWIIVGVVVILVAFISVSVVRQVTAKDPAVKIVEPKFEKITSTLMIPGTVQLANEQVVYPSSEHGELKEIVVKEGQKVKKGDLLATFENPQLSLEIEQNKISKESIQLKIAQLNNKEKQLKKKETELAKAVGKKEAADELAPEYEQVQMERKMANLEVKQVNLEEEAINKRVADLKFTSQVAGTVLKVNKEAESNSTTGIVQPLIQIGSLTGMTAVGTLSEYDTLKVKEGQSVVLRSDAVPDQEWKGEVAKIGTLPIESNAAVAGDVPAVQYPIQVKIKGKSGVLKPGFQLFMDIETETKEALLIPIEALVDEGKETYVFVLKENKVEKQEVVLGITSSERVEIVKGLTEKDKVVENPTAELKSGMEVTVE